MRTGILIALTGILATIIGYASVWRSGVASAEREAAELTGGHPQLGRETVVSLGCVACHDVPGYYGTRPHVGPPLGGFALRTFVAGAIENTPDNLVQFIRDPRSIAPRSAMPKLPMSEAQARDLAAFLYTLR
jgi:cytochrome c